MTRNSTDSTSIGLLLYKSGSFEASIPYLTEKSDQQDSSNEYNLALGSAYLSLNRYDEAIEWFQVNLSSKDELISAYSKWYIALSYLKSDRKKSITVLNEIANSDGPYQVQAKEILDGIK